MTNILTDLIHETKQVSKALEQLEDLAERYENGTIYFEDLELSLDCGCNVNFNFKPMQTNLGNQLEVRTVDRCDDCKEALEGFRLYKLALENIRAEVVPQGELERGATGFVDALGWSQVNNALRVLDV